MKLMKTSTGLNTIFLITILSFLFIQCGNHQEEKCDETEHYTGIEISATSIKKTLLKKDELGNFVPLSKTKTKQLNFSDDAEIDEGELSLIIGELANQFESIARRCIAKERVYIAFSSGLDGISGIDKLKKKIIEELEFPEKNMESINYHVETISAMKTCQHNLTEGELLFIDIGGSNTKIGVYDKSNNLYISERIQLGTRSLEEAIRKEVGDVPTFEEIEEVGTRILSTEIANKFKSNAALRGKSSVLFVGGITYNLVDNIYKNRELNKLMPLNFSSTGGNDLDSYRSAIVNKTVVIPDHLKYNHQELYTGQLILRELWKASEIEVVYYIDQISWMPGFVKYKVSQ